MRAVWLLEHNLDGIDVQVYSSKKKAVDALYSIVERNNNMDKEKVIFKGKYNVYYDTKEFWLSVRQSIVK